MEQEVVESSPTTTIIYQDMSVGESQSATSTIKALLELQQQTTGERETHTHLSKPYCCLCIVIRHTNIFLRVLDYEVNKNNYKKKSLHARSLPWLLR